MQMEGTLLISDGGQRTRSPKFFILMMIDRWGHILVSSPVNFLWEKNGFNLYVDCRV